MTWPRELGPTGGELGSGWPTEDGQEAAFQEMSTEWLMLQVSETLVVDWESELLRMQSEVQTLRSEGKWRSGGRTLLHAMGLHHDEVRLCRALAWLLTPDGWHGLGDRFIRRLFEGLELPVDSVAAAAVVTEDVRGNTRADVVVRAGVDTVLIEAKVFAPEQENQADRLARHWSDEVPTLVYLTRDGGLPSTAKASADQWIGLSWARIAALLDGAVADAPDSTPGVADFLETLKRYVR